MLVVRIDPRPSSIDCPALPEFSPGRLHMANNLAACTLGAIWSWQVNSCYYDTHICSQKLFSIINTQDLSLTLRHKVVLFDVLLKQEFF